MQNLLEIGKIVRTHGIKGAVKVLSYLDGVNFSIFKDVFVGEKLTKAKITKCQPLNGDAYSIVLDIAPNIDAAEKLKNQSVFVDRANYAELKDKLYLSDLVNKPVLNERGKEIGTMVDFDDYGASVVLTIRCGAVSYLIPFVDDIIEYNAELEAFIINQQRFEDVRV